MVSVLDLANRCMVGCSFNSTMRTSLVVDALRMTIANEHPSPGLIFHSDQGSQYCSHVFHEFLQRQGDQWLYDRKWAMLGQRSCLIQVFIRVRGKTSKAFSFI